MWAPELTQGNDGEVCYLIGKASTFIIKRVTGGSSQDQ
jgi:hypothetical protein